MSDVEQSDTAPGGPAAGRRYGEADIARILQTAVELQTRSDARGDETGRGLTLVELRQVAREAGIDPRFVDLAVADADAPERKESRIAGGPIAWRFHAEVEGDIDDQDRTRILQELRSIMGHKGDIETVFGRMEWSANDGLGPVIVGITPGERTTEVDLTANRASEPSLYHGLGVPFGGVFGGAVLASLLGASGAGAVLPLIALSGVGIHLVARLGWRLRSAAYERRLRRVMERVTSIVQERASPRPPIDAE